MRFKGGICAALGCAAVDAIQIPKLAPPVVDLDYASYQGFHDETHDFNVWKSDDLGLSSIRYAEPPTGKRRWQAPKLPSSHHGARGVDVIPAVDPPPLCAQSGVNGLSAEWGFTSGEGVEDCLFLNVYAAPNSKDLPVIIWIRKIPQIATRIPVHIGAMLSKKADIAQMAEGTVIAASPYLSATHRFSDKVPMDNYEAFAKLAGCDKQSHDIGNIFGCLVAADFDTLKNASGIVSETAGHYGTWAFVPVLDGEYLRELPSKQLQDGRVSAKRILVGNDANKGVPLTDPNVSDIEQYEDFVSTTFPSFDSKDRARLDANYKIAQSKPDDDGTRFDTQGAHGPTALTQSGFATGIQRTVFNMAGETLFSCPAQWLAEAFSASGGQAWKYQYSPQPAFYGADFSALFANETAFPDARFRSAMQKIWGRFIINGDPIISVQDATAGRADATVPPHGDKILWPEHCIDEPLQMNLNVTRGHIETIHYKTDDFSFDVNLGPGVVDAFHLADAMKWEGGRGHHCAFCRSVGERVRINESQS